MYHRTQLYTRFTPHNSVQKCMNTSTIFDNIMSANRFARLLMKKTRYSNISHRLTCIFVFINGDYIRHSRFWLNIHLNKGQKHCFSVCHEGVHFRWNEGVRSHFGNWIFIFISTNLLF